jgi:3-hydroxyacyl-CoA dehydrogenase
MVVVSVLGLGQLGGNIAGDLAYNGHTVMAWDSSTTEIIENVCHENKLYYFSDSSAMDKMEMRLAAEKENLKEDKLMQHQDFLVRQDRSAVKSKVIFNHRYFAQGGVYCFGRLEDAVVPEVDLVIEAIAEDLQAKQKLMDSKENNPTHLLQ